MSKLNLLSGVIVEETESLTLEEFCQATKTKREFVIMMVEYHLFQPHGHSPENWRFDSLCLHRGKLANSFYHDLEINLPGVALALQLLDEVERLRKVIAMLPKVNDE